MQVVRQKCPKKEIINEIIVNTNVESSTENGISSNNRIRSEIGDKSYNHHVDGPMTPESGNALNAIPFASAVSRKTVLPHQLNSTPPGLARPNVKKMVSMLRARPESRAAERM